MTSAGFPPAQMGQPSQSRRGCMPESERQSEGQHEAVNILTAWPLWAGCTETGTETKNRRSPAFEGWTVRQGNKRHLSIQQSGEEYSANGFGITGWHWIGVVTHWASYVLLHWFKDIFSPSAWNVLLFAFVPLYCWLLLNLLSLSLNIPRSEAFLMTWSKSERKLCLIPQGLVE